MKTYYFLAGLPRSGSTVLASIINQRPDTYVTPTSPLLDLLIANQNTWHELPSVQANPFPAQITDITRAIIASAWEHRQESIIIDKNRGWMRNIPSAEILFNKKIKLIITTRDLPSIMASWLTLIKKNPNSYFKQHLKSQGVIYTDENIVKEMWFNMVKDCMDALQVAKSFSMDRLLLIDYNKLIDDPPECLNKIESFLELEPFQYDYNNITSDTNDNDLVAWGLEGMHKIRPSLFVTATPAIKVLGDKLYQTFVNIEKNYN
jgi:sulfotransferase